MEDFPLAMAYVPWQQWQNVYDGANGLERGTIFGELIFPFQYPGPGCRNGSGYPCPRSNGSMRGANNQNCRKEEFRCREMTE